MFPLLKYSYDCLPTEEAARSCLLCCSLFPEDLMILKIDLINRWICKGILDEFDDMDVGHDLFFLDHHN